MLRDGFPEKFSSLGTRKLGTTLLDNAANVLTFLGMRRTITLTAVADKRKCSDCDAPARWRVADVAGRDVGGPYCAPHAHVRMELIMIDVERRMKLEEKANA